MAPPDSCDLVLTFRNLHNWMNQGYAKEAFVAMHRALKPGGILGVVGHRGDPAKPQDPRATNGYVNEEYAISLIESAGFELVEKSQLNANPPTRRTTNRECGRCRRNSGRAIATARNSKRSARATASP